MRMLPAAALAGPPHVPRRAAGGAVSAPRLTARGRRWSIAVLLPARRPRR